MFQFRRLSGQDGHGGGHGGDGAGRRGGAASECFKGHMTRKLEVAWVHGTLTWRPGLAVERLETGGAKLSVSIVTAIHLSIGWFLSFASSYLKTKKI